MSEMTDVERVIAEILRGSYTDDGIESWFERTRIQLGDKTPRQALKEGDIEKVTQLALSSLEMSAT